MIDPIDNDNLKMLQALIPMLRENGVQTFDAGGVKLTFAPPVVKTIDAAIKDAFERVIPRPDVQDDPLNIRYEDLFGEPGAPGDNQ